MPPKNRAARARQQREQRRRNIILAVAGGLALLAIVAFLISRNAQASANPTPEEVGQAIPVMPDRSHVPDGTDPGPYNSDPPSSGPHYADPASAGFYDTDPYPSYPAGHLVHSLEHGYVIFWYNCARLSDSDCAALKTQIKDAMQAGGQTKLIAFPWPSIDMPVVMTSWGRLLKFQTFDAQQAAAFIRANRNQAPEPDAP